MWKLLFIFVLFLASTAGAQKLLHYDLADGLSSSEITSICENDYYMWIATEDGLNRFDGHRFKVYKSGKATNNSLKNNNIETLFPASQPDVMIRVFEYGNNPVRDGFGNLFIEVNEQVGPRIVYIYSSGLKANP